MIELNNYCERDKRVTSFFLRRTNEGTVWECEDCHYIILDMSKYKLNYYGLPVEEPKLTESS